MAIKPSAKGKPNIRMVAERAQLSPATVSLALRGSESISAETRARVHEAARQLNYTHASRPSRAQKVITRQLLFVTKDFGDRPVTANPFYGEILKAAELACNEQDARMTFTLLPDTEQAAGDFINSAVLSRPTDGILLVGAYPASIVGQIVAQGSGPLVLVDNEVPGMTCDSVMADDFGGAWRAVQHLVALGHQHIANIAGDQAIPSFAARYRGFAAACVEAEIPVSPPVAVLWDREALRQALEQILARKPQPTAIFCATDAFAVFTMELLRDFGLAVPDDVSVVGFDNLPIARMAHPPLTTIYNHPEQLGRIAVQRLMTRIDGDVSPPLRITVATQLVSRESTRRL